MEETNASKRERNRKKFISTFKCQNDDHKEKNENIDIIIEQEDIRKQKKINKKKDKKFEKKWLRNIKYIYYYLLILFA